MSDQLLQTKLSIPTTKSTLIQRTQLVRRLNLGLTGKATLLSAPAGYGKTTLLATWIAALRARESPPRIIWLSLDDGDNDPARFFGHLVAGFQQVDSAIGQNALAMLQTPTPSSSTALIASLVNDLTQHTDSSIVLVMDDYHQITAKAVHAAIELLLTHLPGLLHIVLATRKDPPLPLARLRASGELTELRQADLRFRGHESAAFLTESMALSLDNAAIEALHARTEGWIVGLQLAALSLRDRDDIDSFVQSFTGSNRYILDYLIDEVFQRQPDHVQSFLLDTSILNRLTGPLCDAVTGGSDSSQMLDALEEANLFIAPLDDSRIWFRYHHLFADLLRHRIALGQRDVSELHMRASRWHAAHELTEEAVDHALLAGDWPWTCALIEESSERLMRRGQTTQLIRWIRDVPGEWIAGHPMLCHNYAWALALTGELDEAERWLALSQGAAATHPAQRAHVIALEAHIARTRRDHPRTIALAHEALQLLPPDDDNAHSIINVNLGAALLYTGDLAGAVAAWTEARRAGARSRNHLAHLTALTFLGRIEAAQGNLHKAADLHDQAFHLWAEQPSLLLIARTFVDSAALCYERNELERAQTQLGQGLELSRRAGEPEIEVAAHRLLAQVQMAQGDADAAFESLETAHQRAQTDEIPHNVRLANALTHMHLALEQRDLQLAQQWRKRAAQVAETLDPPLWATLLAVTGVFRPLPHLAWASLLCAEKRTDEALSLLHEADDQAQRNGIGTALIAGRVVRAVASPTAAEATRHLEEALDLAVGQPFVRTFLDYGGPAAPLLRQILSNRSRRAQSKELLAAVSSAHIPTSPLADPLTQRELEILALLAARRTNHEIAEQLVLSPNTVKTHLQHIYQKLGVQGRRAAAAKAAELHLLN